MRVLHLIDGAAGPTTRLDLTSAACGVLASRLGGEQAVCVAGPASARRRAAAMGAGVRWSVSPGTGRLWTAARGVRRVAAEWAPDVVHCWGEEMLSLSRLAFPAGMATVGVIDRWARGSFGVAHWLESPLTDAILLCYDPAAKERVSDLHPGIEVDGVMPPALRRGADRGGLRAELGLADSDLAVLLVGDAPEADLLRFAFLLGLLEVAGRMIVGVAPASALHRARGQRLRRRALRPIPMVTSDRPLLELAGACDLGVWDAGGPGPTSHREPDAGAGAVAVASLLAGGLPVVAPRCAGLVGLYPAEAGGACLAMNSSLPELARVLVGLGDDRALRERVSAATRRHAEGADWAVAFARTVGDAWSRVARSTGPSLPAAGAPAWGMAT